MLNKFRRFFKEYRQLGLVIVATLLGLALDIADKDSYAHLVLAITSIVAVVPLVSDMLQTLRSGRYGVDILAVTAIVTSVLLKEYWAGIIIVLMLTGGQALEDYAESRAKTELTTLLKHKPQKAHLLKSGKVTDVKVSTVSVSDKLMIYPGDVVPVDCEVIEGTSSLDESTLTGESLPLNKQVGDTLLSGSVNVDGVLKVKVLHIAADSQYQQIIKLVQSAANSQSPFVRLTDRYSVPFTLVSFFIAGGAWIVSGDPVRFLEVIVVATPCPLLLGAPIALISGMSRAAKHGIIVKNGSALERLAEVKTVAFDKTGTLTKGLPSVDKIEAYAGYKKQEVLGLAAALEQSSTHILATAIVSEANKQKIKLSSPKQVTELAGHGVMGRLQGKTITVGRFSLLKNEQVELPKNFGSNIKQTSAYVAVDNKLVGVISFKDEIRSESKSMLARLRRAGIKHTLMVTGDNQATADEVAKQLGITDVRADCLPADKMSAIENIKHPPVAFVGDGVNDAPVLTISDVGIALGAKGSTAASQSADVVIMLDDVNKVASSIEIAQRTFRIARQSILMGIMISIGLMGVFATGKFKAVQGAVIQEVIDVAVIISALRAHGSGRRKPTAK